MIERYIKNISSITKDENNRLKDFKVCVVGCGGLGCYVIEMLSRIGIGNITVVDGDIFQESNLNRQIFSDIDTLGFNKSQIAKDRINKVNPLVHINVVAKMLTIDNCFEILKNHDVIVDALDNVKTKLLLQNEAEKLDIPLVHGSIAGWYGQVTTIFKGDRTLDIIYKKENKGIESEIGNPSFAPALVGAIQVSETIKILLGKRELLRNKLLFIDLLYNDFDIINLQDIY